MRVLLHSADDINKTTLAVLQEAKKLSGVETEFELGWLNEGQTPPAGATVLSLGAYARRGAERIVQTYSVAQIMAKADSLTRLSTAFKLLAHKPDLPEFKYVVVAEEDAYTVWMRLSKADLLTVDIETKGSADAQVPRWEHIISLAFYDGECAYVFPEDLLRDGHIQEGLLLLMRHSKLVLHNGKFDCKYFTGGAPIYPAHDTMLMHYSLYPGASDHGLKPLALQYFGAEDWDSAAKKHLNGKQVNKFTHLEDGAYADPSVKYTARNGYERIPRSMLYEYNARDVAETWHLHQEFSRVLESAPDSQRVYAHLMELSHMFQRVETPGNRYDVDYMLDYAEQLTEEGVELEAGLHVLAERPLNPRSPKQVKEYFADQGISLASTDANTLKDLAEEGNIVAGQITKLRENSKLNGTYVTGYMNQLIGDRGYQTYKLHAATTGRLGGGGPSLLTIPRKKSVKRMVLPDEGQVIVGADASQMELRILALESQDPWLIESFQPEAGDFFDLIMIQAYPDLDPVKLKRDDPGAYTSLRASIKGTIYGKAFNRGDKAIATALGITLAEATKLSNAFIRPGSEFAKWRDEIERKAVSGESIVNRFGRHFQSELVTPRNRQQVVNSAMSFISQSTGNDLLLCAALVVEPRLKEWDSRMMGTIHDAVYCSTPPEHAEVVGEFISQEIIASGARVYGSEVSFVSDWGIGNNLGEV